MIYTKIPTKFKERGFTLIEILIVLCIIGIILKFTVLIFGDFGKKRRTIMAAQQVIHTIKLIEQQAFLEDNTFAMQWTTHGYQVLRFKPPTAWSTLPKSMPFQPQEFPNGTTIDFQGKDITNHNDKLLIYANGDISPFKLNFIINKKRVYTIVGTVDGNLLYKEQS